MSGVGSIHQTTPVVTPTTQGTDKTLQDIENKVGNRSVGGKISSWVRNKTGMKTGASGTTQAFSEALKRKVGSSAEADQIMSQVGIQTNKSLSNRKAAAAIKLADAFVKNNDSAINIKGDNMADSVKKDIQKPETDADKATRLQSNKDRVTDNNNRIATFNKRVALETADNPNYVPKDYEKPLLAPELSHSGQVLLNSLASRLEGCTDKQSASRVADSITKQLGLKDHEPITDKHIAKANELAGRFERFSSSDLATSGKQGVAASNFIGTWENVAKVGTGSDPRFNKLKDDEIVALFVYTTAEYSELNDALRYDQLPDAGNRVKALEASVTSGLANLDPFNGTSYRGSFMPNSYEPVFQKGGIFSDGTYLSSAANDKGSLPGTHQMAIKGHSGRDVSFLSQVPSETEVLFPPGTQFKVIDRQGTISYNPDGSANKLDPNYVRIYMVEM